MIRPARQATATEGEWGRRGSAGWRRVRGVDGGRTDPPTVPGRRDRAALGTVIQGLVDARDLAEAAELIAERAAWLLHADRAAVVRRAEDGGAIVKGAVGSGPAPGARVDVDGVLAQALAGAGARASSGRGRSEVVAPVVLGGAVWGAIVASGPAGRVPAHAAERLAPFADLVSLAAATHEARTRLASLAGTDALTGLGNRRTFDDLLAAEVDRAGRHGEPLSLVLLDIDRFKSVNDRFGHQAGDRVLVEVGRRLVAIARRGEAVTRIGGEEFAWILPRTAGPGAEAAAARGLLAISDAPFEGIGPLTISAGVSELSPEGERSQMVATADRMLYRAKAEGRDRVCRFAPEEELTAA